MYQPPIFRQDDRAEIERLVHAYPFATLIVRGEELSADHIPMVWHQSDPDGIALRGHVARANPLWSRLADGEDALAIFQGPQCYITPSWYPSKKQHGKVVPTWNYTVVHLHGTLRAFDDPGWVTRHLEELTDRHESHRPVPWHVSDLPADYLQRQLKGIVGLELEVVRIEAKWKVSQNRNDADREGVSRGLRLESGGADCPMAELTGGIRK